MNKQENALLSIVNASGFLFQLKIEDEIRRTEQERQGRWRVVARESKWQREQDGNEGFADLLLESGIARMIVECKRVTDASWIFLVPDGAPEVNIAHLLWTRRGPESVPLSSYDSFTVDPSSFQAAFCVVRGQGEKDNPMMGAFALWSSRPLRPSPRRISISPRFRIARRSASSFQSSSPTRGSMPASLTLPRSTSALVSWRRQDSPRFP